jgi:UDP-N-acetylglucosamine diphosphorylase/glucosamine-1-phosphate N-acetyltransferase
MNRALYLLDPAPAAPWAPFAGVRPICELRAGAHLVRERWEAWLGTETREILALPHLAGFVEPGVPAVAAFHPIPGPALVASSTFAPPSPSRSPDRAPPVFPDGDFRLVCGGVTVGWGVAAGATWSGPAPAATTVEARGTVLRGVYDIIGTLERLLLEDLPCLLEERGAIPAGSTVLGDPGAVAVRSAAVEPGVTFDVRHGPIVLDEGVVVLGGTRLEGPLWAGPSSHLLGGRIAGSAIGPSSVVRGELSSCVFLGYANKAHDGFVGHSVLGRWVNVGAGTITSDLKNTYGPVRLTVNGATVETGLTKVGSFIGDHAKTAIGTLLASGTVIGAGASVFDAVRPPKYVPPFAWGADGRERMTREGFVRVAERVLPRRNVSVDDAMRAALGRIYDWAAAAPRRAAS